MGSAQNRRESVGEKEQTVRQLDLRSQGAADGPTTVALGLDGADADLGGDGNGEEASDSESECSSDGGEEGWKAEVARIAEAEQDVQI